MSTELEQQLDAANQRIKELEDNAKTPAITKVDIDIATRHIQRQLEGAERKLARALEILAGARKRFEHIQNCQRPMHVEHELFIFRLQENALHAICNLDVALAEIEQPQSTEASR